jgi:hypothetical protein
VELTFRDVWEPLGPLAPSVYWRRRFAALGVVLAVLGGFVWAVAGLGGGEPDRATVEARARAAAMASAPTPEPAAPTAPTAPAGTGAPGPIEAALPAVVPPGGAPGLVAPPSPDGALFAPPGGDGFRGFLPPGVPTGSTGPLLSTPTSTPAPVVPPSTTPPVTSAPSTEAVPAEPPQERAAAPGPCADSDLTVTARTDAPRYAAGTKPVFSLVVTNTGSTPCVRDLDAAKQAVAVVVRPGEGLWGSNDCSPGDTDDVRTLAPGEEAVFSVRWSGKTSAPGCAGTRTVVPPGDYQLLARLDGIVSEPAPFTLAG